MRRLSDITNTDAPSSDYPGGRIRNKDNTAIPPIVGTPVIEQLYGDIVQFFQRLLVLGSVTANNLADNVTNGYQTVTALWNAILGQFTASTGQTQDGYANYLFVTPYGLSSRTATETRTGLAELATQAEVLTGTDAQRIVTAATLTGKNASQAEVLTGTETNKIVTPATLAGKDGGTLKKYLEIGDWNMLSTSQLNISFATAGVTYDKIIGLRAMIRNDSDTNGYEINFAGYVYKHSTNGISLNRNPAGAFESTSFDSTSYNRGWVIIEYLP
jgi:hypothetical protein